MLQSRNSISTQSKKALASGVNGEPSAACHRFLLIFCLNLKECRKNLTTESGKRVAPFFAQFWEKSAPSQLDSKPLLIFKLY